MLRMSEVALQDCKGFELDDCEENTSNLLRTVFSE